jgi:hypothetical protein
MLVRFLAFLVLIAPLHAQDALRDRTGLRDDLKVYFDRADKTTTLVLWMATATQGLSIAADWEKPLFEKMLAERLDAWQSTRAANLSPSTEIRGLLDAIARANDSWLFIMVDGKRTYRAKETRTDDLANWSSYTKEQREAILDQWESRAFVSFQEIFGADVHSQATFNEYKRCVTREFDLVYTQEKRMFLHGRTVEADEALKDPALRHAAEYAKVLIAGTEQDLKDVEAILTQGLNDAWNLPDDKLAIAMDEWEESFRTRMAAGVARWNRAEQDMIRSRLEWEQRARDSYAAGVIEWENAFKSFEAARVTARDNWLLGIDHAVRQGTALWTARKEAFGKDYAKATDDIMAAGLRLASGEHGRDPGTLRRVQPGSDNTQ